MAENDLYIVTCELENASSEMNGIPFEKHPKTGHMVAKDVPAEHANRFGSIEGFTAEKQGKKNTSTSKKTTGKNKDAAASGSDGEGEGPVILEEDAAIAYLYGNPEKWPEFLSAEESLPEDQRRPAVLEAITEAKKNAEEKISS